MASRNKTKTILYNIKMAFMSLFYRRDKSIVLFGAWFGNKFADNSRFLFQYLSLNKEHYGLTHVVWVTRDVNVCKTLQDMGYEVYNMDSKESIYYHKKAKYHIICNYPYNDSVFAGDIMGEYSYRAKKLNLWHGVGGIKGVARSSNEFKESRKKHPNIGKIKDFIRLNSRLYRVLTAPGGWDNCYYLSTTQYETDIMQKRNLLPRKHYIESGFPRNCKCPQLTKDEEKVIRFISKYDYVIMYLPTFRDNGSVFSTDDVEKYLLPIIKKYNAIWIQKAHSADKSSSLTKSLSENILSLDVNFDINVIMPYITLLVTDYSSAASDAMYHNKSVLYYVPDFDEYKKGSRGFAIDPEEVMCGPKLYTIDELHDALNVYISNPDSAKLPQYESVRKRFWNDVDSLSDIWSDILKVIK